MESCFSRFKAALIYAEQYGSIQAARSGIFEYIEVFYSRVRRRSAVSGNSPAVPGNAQCYLFSWDVCYLWEHQCLIQTSFIFKQTSRSPDG
jgi:Integrase core domain